MDNVETGCKTLRDCSHHGLCLNGKCTCEPGYTGLDCARVDQGAVAARCPNACSQRGTCLFGKCFCDPDYTGRACDQVLTCPEDCNHRGVCRYGKCFCYPGYRNVSCGEEVSEGCVGGCGDDGVCFRQTCLCPKGFSGDHCEIPQNATKDAATKLMELAQRHSLHLPLSSSSSSPSSLDDNTDEFSSMENQKSSLLQQSVTSTSPSDLCGGFHLSLIHWSLIVMGFLTGGGLMYLRGCVWREKKEKK